MVCNSGNPLTPADYGHQRYGGKSNPCCGTDCIRRQVFVRRIRRLEAELRYLRAAKAGQCG